MTCSKCGSTVAEDKRFCPQCGNPIRTTTIEPARSHPGVPGRPRTIDMTRTRVLPPEPGETRTMRKVYRADIVFTFDCTGSMAPYIKGLKDTAIEFSRDLEDNNIDGRLGLIEYRDLECGEEIHNHGFARSPEEFRSWVARLADHGGGDEPESAIEALSMALEMPFREGAARIVTLITDASYHEPGQNGRTMEDLCQEFRTRKTVAYVIGPDLPGYVQLSDCMGGILFNIESDPKGFRRILKSLGKSVSETVPRMTDVRAAADAALGRSRAW